ncbi:histamine H3 receptor-like [Ambystoma mexicanum]|uniref:histamine H3 receptor-like n=1 Tax=Ambystoma mexicanum TaxID=8296 RepID=UPI0037E940A6
METELSLASISPTPTFFPSNPPEGETFSATTSLPPSDAYQFSGVTLISLGALMSFMVSIIVLGNALVILAFVTDKSLKNHSNYLLFNLAICDFCVGSFSIPLYIPYVLTGRWLLGRFLCKLWLSVDTVLCVTSICTIVLISYDRFLSVTKAVLHPGRCPGFSHGWIEYHGDVAVNGEEDESWNQLFKVLIGAYNEQFSFVIIRAKVMFCHPGLKDAVDLIDVGRVKNNKFGKFSWSPALQFYKSKVIPALTYGMEANLNLPPETWSKLEGYLWKSVLALPKSAPMPAIRRDLGLPSVASVVTQSAVQLYRKILSPSSPPIIRLMETEISKGTCKPLLEWVKKIHEKLDEVACLTETLLSNPGRVKRKLENQDWINTSERILQYKSLEHLPPTHNRPRVPLKYCERFPEKKLRKKFMRARLNLLNTKEILASRARVSDSHCRLCEDTVQAETIYHLLMSCPALEAERQKYLAPLTSDETTLDEETRWYRLIAGDSPRWSRMTAKFLDVALRRANTPVTSGLRARMENEPSLKTTNKSNARESKDIQIAKSLSVIVCIFSVCWTPYSILMVIRAACHGNCIESFWYEIAFWLLWLNSFINPFLYPLCHSSFKKAFAKLLLRKC